MNKFLTLGILAFTLSLNSYGQNSAYVDKDVQLAKQFIKDINDTYNKQLSKGLMHEHAHLTLNVVNDLNITHKDSDKLTQQDSHIYIDSSSKQYRSKGQCEVEVSFDSNGDINSFTQNKTIVELTKFQNNVQRKIARDFIALHEHFHCEFSTINYPVIALDQSNEVNEKLSYILRDQTKNKYGTPTYFDLLNENFADTAAFMTLIKEFGVENKDLMYVLNAIESRRHDNYLHVRMDTHFTHLSLEQVLSPEIIQQVSAIDDYASFEKLALQISNRGTQNILSYREFVSEPVFDLENIRVGSLYYIRNLLLYESLSDEVKKQFNPFTPWSKDVERGLAYHIAEVSVQSMSPKEIKELHLFTPEGNEGSNYPQVMNQVNLLFNKTMADPSIIEEFDTARKLTTNFKDSIYKHINKNDIDYIYYIPLPDDMEKRVDILKQKFVKNTMK